MAFTPKTNTAKANPETILKKGNTMKVNQETAVESKSAAKTKEFNLQFDDQGRMTEECIFSLYVSKSIPERLLPDTQAVIELSLAEEVHLFTSHCKLALHQFVSNLVKESLQAFKSKEVLSKSEYVLSLITLNNGVMNGEIQRIMSLTEDEYATEYGESNTLQVTAETLIEAIESKVDHFSRNMVADLRKASVYQRPEKPISAAGNGTKKKK